MAEELVEEGFEALSELDPVADERSSGRRLALSLDGARALRERLLSDREAVCVRTLPISRLLYPTKYALWATALSPAPFVVMHHRCLLVQFRQGERVRTLLFNPTDARRSRRTPFFAQLIERFGERMTDLVARASDPLELQLARLGLKPEDIDYVAFDHLHTQDLRGLLGPADRSRPARFPRAKLLVPRREWDDWDQLHPLQKAWYVADGKQDVDTASVRFTDRDLRLGDGVLLLRTPGHTSGNQTLFFRTERGIYGCSENGTAADNWSPRASRIAGVASGARTLGVDVVLNANTPEGGADQYTSMMVEKTLVDPCASNGDFVQMFPSSELVPDLLAPGVSPSFVHGDVRHGTVHPASSP